jgi:hypothetical protein
MPLTSGETFAGYRIVRLLGSGGMGEVYLADHPRLPRRDALKVLPAGISADPDYRARFNREADLAFDLGPVQAHGDVVTVSMVANGQESGGSACQQVMAVRANVVIAVRACRYPEPPPGELNADVSSVRKDAEPLASAMIDKVRI